MMKDSESILTRWVAFGVVFGTTVGAITDNIGLWLSLSIAIGAGVGTTLAQQARDAASPDDSVEEGGPPEESET